MSWCPSCGNEVADGWRFCRSCGARLDAAPESGSAATEGGPGSEEPTAPIPWVDTAGAATPVEGPRRRRRWPRVAALVVGILALAGGIAEGAWVYAQTREDLEQTRAELQRTTDKLTATEQDLELTRLKLEDERERSSSLQREVQRLRTELRGVRGTLSEAEQRLELQAGQIEDLKDCLNGVSMALDSVLYGDYRGAANALVAVESDCQAAFSLF